MARGRLAVSSFHSSFRMWLNSFFISGEIDIMESRGNAPTYSGQYVELIVLPFRQRRSSVFTEVSTSFEDHSTGVPCRG